MSKIISCEIAARITHIPKNTIIRYLNAGDFPQPVPNPKNFYLFFEDEVQEWAKNQKEFVMKKWHDEKYKNKTRTINYISQVEQKLLIDQLVKSQLV